MITKLIFNEDDVCIINGCCLADQGREWLLMEKSQSKEIRVKLSDSSVWMSFLEYIEDKHGKTYGVVGIELQNALIHYLKCPEEVDIKQLVNTHEYELKKLQDLLNQKTNEHDKLRNRHDHLQERFIKGQKDLNVLERENSQLRVVVAKIEKMSFFERVLKRLPEEVKQLTTTEDLK